MAAIDSRRAGILTPNASNGSDDPTDRIRLWLSGLTGIPPEKVRRRWQSRPGTRPGLGEDWCAVGIERIRTHGTPEQVGRRGELSDAESGDIARISHQSLPCVASFYGPNAQTNADAFREGCQVPQNIDELRRTCGCVLRSVEDEVMHLPDFLCEQWVDRYDIRFVLGRRVERRYGVRTLCAVGEPEIHTERGKL